MDTIEHISPPYKNGCSCIACQMKRNMVALEQIKMVLDRMHIGDIET